jgi:acyl carrier protein
LSNQHNGKEFLIELRLREEFQDDLKHFSLHPAMLDVATSCSIPLIDRNLYLPYSYKNIEVFKPLPGHFWCHVKLDEQWKPGDDDIKFEVSLIDSENNILVSIKQVLFRRLMQNVGKSGVAPSIEAEQKPVQEPGVFAGKNDILPEEGVEVFKHLLKFPRFPQVVINTTDLNQDILEERPSYKKREKQEKEVEKSEGVTAYERPQLSTPYEAPSNEIEMAVAGIWKGILGIDKIGVNDTFMELGGNSLLAIQTISNIADEFDLELQPGVFFENPTVRAISDRIVEMIIALKGSDEIEAMLKEIENEQ